nr:zeta toxin family protein [Spirosoma utsteinense]
MTTEVDYPVLHLFAGPNGAGKSTLFAFMQKIYLLDTVSQINGDVIYKENPRLTQDELAAIVGQLVKESFQNRHSFSFESNLATSASYTVVQSARQKGYRIILRYVNLDSATHCRDRVIERVSKGGHDVPYAIIEQRYKNALSLIKQHYLLFDDIDFIDNSAGSFTSVLRVETGKLTYQAEKLPAWAVGIVNHIRMMEKAIRKTNAD